MRDAIREKGTGRRRGEEGAVFTRSPESIISPVVPARVQQVPVFRVGVWSGGGLEG